MEPKAQDRGAGEVAALEAVIEAQRAEQRNAESLLSRLGEAREALRARGSEEARGRIDALDREIAAVATRVKQALRRQGELMMEIGRRGTGRDLFAG